MIHDEIGQKARGCGSHQGSRVRSATPWTSVARISPAECLAGSSGGAARQSACASYVIRRLSACRSSSTNRQCCHRAEGHGREDDSLSSSRSALIFLRASLSLSLRRRITFCLLDMSFSTHPPTHATLAQGCCKNSGEPPGYDADDAYRHFYFLG